MRPSGLLPILMIVAFAAPLALASEPRFADSPYLEPIPDFGSCDVIVSEATPPASLQALFDDPAQRVFCIEPGDYRAAGAINLWESGSESQRRFLRFHADDGVRNAVQRPARAIFERVQILGSWWVVQGLSFQPRDPASTRILVVTGGDHNVLDGNLVDAGEQPNAVNQGGIHIGGHQGDAATFNTVQANVVRNGNRSRIWIDYGGVMIREGGSPGEDNDFNKVLDNEIYDWGDGVAVAGHRDDCAEAGIQRGTLIDGNDIYLTAAKRSDCATGAEDPDGDCACAENAIEVKSPGGPEPEQWTHITNNRVWGFRPTALASCGGSGGNGQAISAGNTCAGRVLVARNLILDSTQGVTAAGESWVIAGNLIADIRASSRTGNWGTLAIFPASSATDVRVEFNTVVGVDNAYDDQSDDTDTRCNAVIDDLDKSGGGGFRGLNHSTEHNFLYHSPAGSFQGSSNESYATAAESGNTQFCFWRKRWTAPERVCVPFGNTTPASVHNESAASCNADLLAPFGMDALAYPTEVVPEPGSVLLGAAGIAAVGALRRSRTNRSRRRH